MVVLPPDGARVHALNESGKEIFALCDGRHTLEDMVDALRVRFDAGDAVLMADVSAAVFDLQELGLVHIPPRSDGVTSVAPAAGHKTRPNVRFVFGVEDRPYFHWQLAILFESMVGQLPDGWDVTAVVCNDDVPISDDLTRIGRTYGVRLLA